MAIWPEKSYQPDAWLEQNRSNETVRTLADEVAEILLKTQEQTKYAQKQFEAFWIKSDLPEQPSKTDVSQEIEKMMAEALGLPELIKISNGDSNKQVADAFWAFENLPNQDKNAVLQAINFDVQPWKTMNLTEQQDLAKLKFWPVSPEELTYLS